MSNAEATDHVFSRYGDNDKTQSILRDLKEQGYILLKWNLDNPAVVVPLEKCQHYLAMEQDNVANNYREEIPMFEPLFGTEEEIMLAIYNKTPGDAMKYLYDTYADEQGSLQGIRSDIDSLSIKKYIKVRYADGLIYGLSSILPKCKDYPHKKAYNATQQKSYIYVDARDNKGNVGVSGSNMSNINQTISIEASVREMLELIQNMRESVKSLQVDDKVKWDIDDTLKAIVNEVTSETPEPAFLERKKNQLLGFIDIVKNITPIPTLVLQIQQFAPQLAMFISTLSTGSCPL